METKLNSIRRITITFVALAITLSSAYGYGHFRHRYWGRRVPLATWQHGSWFHGAYHDHFGWWWCVGPYWYFYDGPVYPYPPSTEEPVYFIAAPNLPPPPPVPVSTPSRTPLIKGARAFTYSCEKPPGYYPTVPACAGGWIVTPVKPPN